MDNGLSMAMLGWKAEATCRNTLESWKRSDLFNCGEFFVFFNQIRESDRAMAAEFGVPCYGAEKNLGIWGGMEAIARQAKGDYLLFLDDDHNSVTSKEETKKWIDSSLELLRSGKADMVILINRFPGWGVGRFFDFHYVHELDPRLEGNIASWPKTWNRDTLYRKLHRIFRPDATRRRLITVAFVEKHPELVCPDFISKEGDFYILDSAIQTFCEAPVMMSRKFFEKITAWARLHPRHRTILGFQELEYVMNRPWWRRQHFKIAVCDTGVFSHNRLDGSWRPDHECFDRTLAEGGKKE